MFVESECDRYVNLKIVADAVLGIYILNDAARPHGWPSSDDVGYTIQPKLSVLTPFHLVHPTDRSVVRLIFRWGDSEIAVSDIKSLKSRVSGIWILHLQEPLRPESSRKRKAAGLDRSMPLPVWTFTPMRKAAEGLTREILRFFPPPIVYHGPAG